MRRCYVIKMVFTESMQQNFTLLAKNNNYILCCTINYSQKGLGIQL